MAKELNFNNLNLRKSKQNIDLDKATTIIHAKTEEKEPIERISLNVPKSLYKEIKMHCLVNETDMTKFIISAIHTQLGKG